MKKTIRTFKHSDFILVFILSRIFHNDCLFSGFSGFMLVYQVHIFTLITRDPLNGPTLCWTTLDPMTVKESGSSMMDRKWGMTQHRIHTYGLLEMVGLLWEDVEQTLMQTTRACRSMNLSILMLHWKVMMFS